MRLEFLHTRMKQWLHFMWTLSCLPDHTRVKLVGKKIKLSILLLLLLLLIIDLAENEDILKYIQFVGGGKKLRKIPSAHMTHPHLSPVLNFSSPLGPPSPDLGKKPFTPSRTRMYSIDMGEFERERTRSKPREM